MGAGSRGGSRIWCQIPSLQWVGISSLESFSSRKKEMRSNFCGDEQTAPVVRNLLAESKDLRKYAVKNSQEPDDTRLSEVISVSQFPLRSDFFSGDTRLEAVALDNRGRGAESELLQELHG